MNRQCIFRIVGGAFIASVCFAQVTPPPGGGGGGQLACLVTPASDNLAAFGGDTTIAWVNGGTTNNSANMVQDSTVFFNTTCTLASFNPGQKATVCAGFGDWSLASNERFWVELTGKNINLSYDVYGNTASQTNLGFAQCWGVTLNPAGTQLFTQVEGTTHPMAVFASNGNKVAQPVTGSFTSALQFKVGIAYIDQHGLNSGTYSSGGTFTGTGGCALTGYGTGGSAAAATLNIVGGVASSTLTITNTGQLYTAGGSFTPTIGACTGTATATGPITISVNLGPAQGHGIALYYLSVRL